MTYQFAPAYPTPQHQRSAELITEFFSRQAGVSAVLLTCSCARGRASRDSCLDIAVLLNPALPAAEQAGLEAAWQRYQQAEPAFAAQRAVGRFSQVDLDLTRGEFDPARHPHGWTSGADSFELEVGNLLAYSHPLWIGDYSYAQLKSRWLPYYDEDLRRTRLDMTLKYCRNNLEHIPLYVRRGLFFQSFKRLYQAFEEFLQALFIARRVYPLAYDKWVREQVVEILELPALYPRLVHLLEVSQLESDELIDKAEELQELLREWVLQPS